MSARMPTWQGQRPTRPLSPLYTVHHSPIGIRRRLVMAQRKVTTGAVCSAVALWILLAALPVAGQTLKGTLLGTISDSSHAVVPEVQVSLTETNTNFHLVQKTNESGF